MIRINAAALAVLGSLASMSFASAVEGDAARGQGVFRACAACHSLRPNQNMTGPSLADLWNRTAGGLPGFHRYSDALKSSGVVWNDKTLDQWIENPQQVVPGNTMTFPGIKEPQARADLLAFLKQAAEKGGAQSAERNAPMGGAMRGGMGGMMGGQQVPHLKKLDPGGRVQSITYCKDTYTITTVDGKVHKYWERNLRLKTDMSEDGPEKDAPALVGAGMMGDRASVIFAAPSEISAAITSRC